MRAQIISFALILSVALVVSLLGLTIKSEKEKIKKTWSWSKFKR
ncbi:MAG: hypothetical protein WCN88_01945 [Candidatus Falkowbacteria bacterium]